MTIRELIQKGQKEHIYASCLRCFRKGRPVFKMSYDRPTPEQIDRVRMKAARHDRTGKHNISIMIYTK